MKWIEVERVPMGYPASACLHQYYKAADIFFDVLQKLYGNKFVVLCCTGTSGLTLASSIVDRRRDNTVVAFVRRDVSTPHHTSHREESVESLLIRPNTRTGVPNGLTEKCSKIWRGEDIGYHMVFVDDFIETGRTMVTVSNAIDSLGRFRKIEAALTMSSQDKYERAEQIPDSIRFLTYYNF